MAAPTPTARGTPSGIMLENGYRTLVTFSLLPTLSIWEKTVKPMSLDNGDPIDQTTMHQEDLMTCAPRQLSKQTPGKIVAAYDPIAITQLQGMIGRRQVVTTRYPDGSTEAAFGFIQKYDISDHLLDSAQPEMTIDWMPTAWDPTNRVEAQSAVSSVSGT